MTTLFPGVSHRTRIVLTGMVFGVATLIVVTALLKWQAVLIGLVGLGLPVVFVAYLTRIDVPRRASLAAASMAVGCGVGWGLGTEAAAARTGPDALGNAGNRTLEIVASLSVAVGFVVLLLAPVFVLRGRTTRTPLSGYAIGALTGVCFAAAGTLSRLASLFTAGQLAGSNRQPAALAVAAGIQGLAIPLTAAAVAGCVGATLWTERAGRTQWYAVTSPIPSVVVALLAYLGLGLLDLTGWTSGVQSACYAGLTVLALAFLRIVGRQSMIDESVTDGARPTARWALATTMGVVAVMTASTALSWWLTPPRPNYVCPPDCGRPPLRTPVATNPRFTPANGAFSVSYPGEDTAYVATFEPTGVTLDLRAGDGGTLHLLGQPAAGRSAQRVVEDYLAAEHPDARTDYEIPHALVGYQLGYGRVSDVYPTDSIDGTARLRVLVMSAVKDDYAVIAAGSGPFREFSPDFGTGHPSGANFLLALDMGKYVNSFAWRGDPPR